MHRFASYRAVNPDLLCPSDPLRTYLASAPFVKPFLAESGQSSTFTADSGYQPTFVNRRYSGIDCECSADTRASEGTMCPPPVALTPGVIAMDGLRETEAR